MSAFWSPRHPRPFTDYATTAVLEAEPVALAPVEDTLPTTARWGGPIGMEGQITGDGRSIALGALQWAEDLTENPIPLRFVREDNGAHDGAVVVGGIDTIERRPGGIIWGEGDFDMEDEDGRKAYRAVLNKRMNGISMDLDDVSFEIRVAAEVVAEVDAMMEALDGEEGEEPEREVNEDGTVTVAKVSSGDEVMLTTDARIRAATQVAVPAFAEARILILSANDSEEEVPPATRDALAAAAAPMHPPAEWFADPELTEPTALTVTPDGQVFGHLALWGTCHVSHSAGGQCVTPPNSASGYSWFHTGALETESGSEIAVGHLTMGTGHAKNKLSPAETLSHYDHTGTVAADVRAGEDAHGIWVSGALRPHLSVDDVRAFRAAPLSGDWRRVGFALELVAALSVNVPGFGVPRPSGMVASGDLVSLVASGIVVDADAPESRWLESLSATDLAYLKKLAGRERDAEVRGFATRVRRVKVSKFAATRKDKV